jgi:hypothetical protein
MNTAQISSLRSWEHEAEALEAAIRKLANTVPKAIGEPAVIAAFQPIIEAVIQATKVLNQLSDSWPTQPTDRNSSC